MNDRWNERSKIAEEYFEYVFRPIFPKMNISLVGEWFSNNSDPITAINIDLSKNISVFQNSFLEYKGKKQFLHFTNIQSALNILKTGVIRLYDFNHLSDEMEFKYVYHSLDKSLTDYQELIWKKNLFCFSMLENNYHDLYDDSLGYYWCHYGNHYKGVCLRLEIQEDNIESCNRFLLGKIQYEVNTLKQIDDLNIRNKEFIKNKRVTIQNFNELTHIICSFFKEPRYVSENEIRLLSYQEKSDPNILSFSDEINKQFKVVSFLEIPININNRCPPKLNTDYFKQIIYSPKCTFPKIIIKKIYFGKSIPSESLNDCMDLFYLTIKENGYTIKIKNYDKNKLYLND